MKKRILISLSGLAIVLFAMFTTSCMSVPVYEHGTRVKPNPKDYTILGRVEYRGKWQQVCGVGWGGATYSKLYEKAKQEFGADDVINVSIDYIDALFLGVYNQKTWVMSGLAVKYK